VNNPGRRRTAPVNPPRTCLKERPLRRARRGHTRDEIGPQALDPISDCAYTVITL